MIEISPIVFYVFAVIAIAASLLVVFNRNAISSAFSLILVFFSFAGIYAALGAHLVAALQVLVYAGAVMVLFVFVIMLLNASTLVVERRKTGLTVKLAVAVAGVIFVALLVSVFKNHNFASIAQGPFSAQNVKAAGGNTKVIAELLFSEYVLPFELTSILLLAGVVAAVSIAMRKKGVR